MDIRFVSSLTAEDENSIAPALLKAVAALLDQLPIAYTVRIETTGSQVLQHTHAGPKPEAARETPRVAPADLGWSQSADDQHGRSLSAATLRR